MVIFLFLSSGGWVFGQGSLGEVIGTVVDSKSTEGIFDAKVWIEDNDKVYQTKTDPDGRFRISAVPAGSYNVIIKSDLDTMFNIPVLVAADGFGSIGVVKFQKMLSTDIGEHVVNGVYQKLKLEITAIPTYKLSSADIKHNPSKFSIPDMLTSMSPEIKKSDDGELMFRGSRKGEMLYLIDGVKTSSIGTIPSCAIGSMTVYTGGMPAKYGDTLGGVVILETKSYFDLLKERNSNQ